MSKYLTVSELSTLIQTKLISQEIRPNSPVEVDIEGIPRLRLTGAEALGEALVLTLKAKDLG